MVPEATVYGCSRQQLGGSDASGASAIGAPSAHGATAPQPRLLRSQMARCAVHQRMFAARGFARGPPRREGALISVLLWVTAGAWGVHTTPTLMKAALLLGAVCLATRGAAQQWQPPRACSQTPQNCNFPPRPGVDAICCNFDNAHLQGEFLFGTTFEECSFRNAHLERADLGEAEFAACDLTGAKLDHANLKMAQFDMGGANNAPRQVMHGTN